MRCLCGLKLNTIDKIVGVCKCKKYIWCKKCRRRGEMKNCEGAGAILDLPPPPKSKKEKFGLDF